MTEEIKAAKREKSGVEMKTEEADRNSTHEDRHISIHQGRAGLAVMPNFLSLGVWPGHSQLTPFEIQARVKEEERRSENRWRYVCSSAWEYTHWNILSWKNKTPLRKHLKQRSGSSTSNNSRRWTTVKHVPLYNSWTLELLQPNVMHNKHGS